MSNHTTLPITSLSKHISAILKVNEVAFVAGSPGIGKSAVFAAVAKEYNLKFIDFRLSMADFTDLVGLPYTDPETNRAAFAPPKLFPLAGDALPTDENGTSYDGWLISFEEINSAPKSIQAIAYKILHDRMVGDYHLHPAVRLIANGNLESDGAVVEPMSSALASRMIQLETFIEPTSWLKWAMQTDIFSPKVLSYLSYRPNHVHKFDPNSSDKSFPCPRTWSKASKLIALNPDNPMEYRASIEGCVGAAIAADFNAFINYFAKIPNISDVMKDPLNYPLPAREETGVMYAIICSFGEYDKTVDEYLKIFKYITRFKPEYILLFLRISVRTPNGQKVFLDPTVYKAIEPYFDDFVKKMK